MFVLLNNASIHEWFTFTFTPFHVFCRKLIESQLIELRSALACVNDYQLHRWTPFMQNKPATPTCTRTLTKTIAWAVKLIPVGKKTLYGESGGQ